MRNQAIDLNKRKAVEYAQSAADLKLHVEKLTSQLSEAQQAVATKTSSLKEESFKISRLQVSSRDDCGQAATVTYSLGGIVG